MANIDAIKEFVSDIVSRHWDECGRAVMLSSIGVRIKRNFEDFDARSVGGVRDFCKKIPTIKVISFPGIEEKAGLVPADANLPEDLSLVFSNKSEAVRTPIYARSFWTAFTAARERSVYASIYPHGAFKISEDRDPDASMSIEILTSDVSGALSSSTIPEKVRATHERIDAWLRRNSIDGRVFTEDNGERRAIGPLSKGSLKSLVDALSSLDREDLKRIKIPADIIVKLFEKH